MNKTMKTVAVVAVAGIVAGGMTVWAADTNAVHSSASAAKTAAAKAKVAADVEVQKELMLTGVVAKRDAMAFGRSYTCFVLITTTGDQIRLPVAKASKKANSVPVCNPADFVGQNVKLVAVGIEQKKGDKVVVQIKSLKAMEKVASLPSATTSAKKMT